MALSECPPKRIIVVTDLDGTLLDHDTYDCRPVLPLIDRLQQHDIPLIANTSKTSAEWLHLRQKFHNTAPFIIENGSALHDLKKSPILLGATRTEILAVIDPLRPRFQFTGYSGATPQEIVDWTGLTHQEALQSADRHYSEPLLWQDSPEAEKEFCQLIEEAGLKTLRGGRFLHVLGDTDKGKALAHLRSPGTHIIALGDRPNDAAMLAAADTGIAIAAPDGVHHIPGSTFLRSSLPGPQGWAEMMTPLLDSLLR